MLGETWAQFEWQWGAAKHLLGSHINEPIKVTLLEQCLALSKHSAHVNTQSIVVVSSSITDPVARASGF